MVGSCHTADGKALGLVCAAFGRTQFTSKQVDLDVKDVGFRRRAQAVGRPHHHHHHHRHKEEETGKREGEHPSRPFCHCHHNLLTPAVESALDPWLAGKVVLV